MLMRSGFCPADDVEYYPGQHEHCPGRGCECAHHTEPIHKESPGAAPDAGRQGEAHAMPDQQTKGGKTSLVTEPGLYDGIPDETYHADPIPGGSLSSTFARLLTNHVPIKADAVRRNRKPTKAMNLGKAAHAHALGAGPRLIVWEHDGRTKEGKAERAAVADLIASEAAVAVTEAERDQILGMVEALRAHPEVVTILEESRPEVSGFWQEPAEVDVWCRARYDLLGKVRAHDYKTCEDSTRRGFSKAMGRYAYHQQAEFYQRGLAALGHAAAKHTMRFICQETAPPYLVQIHTPDEEAMEVARELNDRAIRIFAESIASGTWAGYERLAPDPVPLPSFYFFDHDDVLPDHWRPVEQDIVIPEGN